MSDSLWPPGLHYARLLCPPLTPWVCSNSCPLSQWCYLTISSSVTPSPFADNLSQHQGLFQWVGSSHQVAKVLGLQLQHQSFQIGGKTMETVTDFLSFGSKITADGDCSHEIKRRFLLGRKAMTNLDSILKNRETFANKGLSSQKHGFSSSHVWMWELDHKECWGLKNRCFWTVVLKTLESPSDCKEIKPVNPKGNKSWIFIGRTDYEAEVPILWLPDVKNWLIGKDPAAGEGWKQEEKGTTEDGMVGWHHWLNGHEFEQTLGIDDGQGSLACCSPWGHKESDMTKWLNWTEKLNKIWAK